MSKKIILLALFTGAAVLISGLFVMSILKLKEETVLQQKRSPRSLEVKQTKAEKTENNGDSALAKNQEDEQQQQETEVDTSDWQTCFGSSFLWRDKNCQIDIKYPKDCTCEVDLESRQIDSIRFHCSRGKSGHLMIEVCPSYFPKHLSEMSVLEKTKFFEERFLENFIYTKTTINGRDVILYETSGPYSPVVPSAYIIDKSCVLHFSMEGNVINKTDLEIFNKMLWSVEYPK